MKYPRIAEDKSQLEAFKNETDAKLADSLSCLVVPFRGGLFAEDVNKILANIGSGGKNLPMFIDKNGRLIPLSYSVGQTTTVTYYDNSIISSASGYISKNVGELVADTYCMFTDTRIELSSSTGTKLYKHEVTLQFVYTTISSQQQHTRNFKFYFLSTKSTAFVTEDLDRIKAALSCGHTMMTYHGLPTNDFIIDISYSYPQGDPDNIYDNTTSKNTMLNVNAISTANHFSITGGGSSYEYHVYAKDTIDISTGEVVAGDDLVENSSVTVVSDTVTAL